MIGAGLAGLSAAYELHQAGVEVLVLEARNRVGGRVTTVRDLHARQHAEGGAEFIDLDHSLMASYVDRFGPRRGPELSPYDRAIVGGSAIPFGAASKAGLPGDVARLLSTHLFSADLGRHYFRPCLERNLARYHGNEEQAMAAVRSRSVLGVLKEANASSEELRYPRTRLVPAEGVELDAVSALSLAQGPWPDDYQTRQYRIAGGNDLLPGRLADALGARIQLGCEVTAIEQTTREATVHFQRGADRQQAVATRVVLTVPVTAVRRLRFDPPLSGEKAAALSAVSYATVLKVHLRVSERFWDHQGWNGNLVTDLPLRVWHATESQEGAGGILTCYVSGSPASDLRRLSRHALVESLLRELGPAIRPWNGTPEQATVVDWIGDAYAGGGWIVYPLQSRDDLRAILAEPHGRCLFAGEHLATEHRGTMEGALRSGCEVARRTLR